MYLSRSLFPPLSSLPLYLSPSTLPSPPLSLSLSFSLFAHVYAYCKNICFRITMRSRCIPLTYRYGIIFYRAHNIATVIGRTHFISGSSAVHFLEQIPEGKVINTRFFLPIKLVLKFINNIISTRQL